MIFDKNEGFAWISYLQANRGFKAGKRLFCTEIDKMSGRLWSPN